MTRLDSGEAGAATAIRQIWPIIVGIVIVCVLAAIVALVMYKTGAFSKLRFFKDRLDEEEENENKRQSMRYPEHNE